MTNQQILEKAIQKAIDGGWMAGHDFVVTNVLTVGFRNEPEGISKYQGWVYNSYAEVIYNHNFAKALWPDVPNYKLNCPSCDADYNWWDDGETERWGGPPAKYCGYDGTKLKKVEDGNNKPWWGHLRGMVVANDPIQYLGDHLPN